MRFCTILLAVTAANALPAWQPSRSVEGKSFKIVPRLNGDLLLQMEATSADMATMLSDAKAAEQSWDTVMKEHTLTPEQTATAAGVDSNYVVLVSTTTAQLASINTLISNEACRNTCLVAALAGMEISAKTANQLVGTITSSSTALLTAIGASSGSRVRRAEPTYEEALKQLNKGTTNVLKGAEKVVESAEADYGV